MNEPTQADRKKADNIVLEYCYSEMEPRERADLAAAIAAALAQARGEGLERFQDACRQSINVIEFLWWCIEGKAQHAYPEQTQAHIDLLHHLAPPITLVCVLCGRDWKSCANRCECGGVCTWGKEKGGKPSSWRDDGSPNPPPTTPMVHRIKELENQVAALEAARDAGRGKE